MAKRFPSEANNHGFQVKRARPLESKRLISPAEQVLSTPELLSMIRSFDRSLISSLPAVSSSIQQAQSESSGSPSCEEVMGFTGQFCVKPTSPPQLCRKFCDQICSAKLIPLLQWMQLVSPSEDEPSSVLVQNHTTEEKAQAQVFFVHLMLEKHDAQYWWSQDRKEWQEKIEYKQRKSSTEEIILNICTELIAGDSLLVRLAIRGGPSGTSDDVFTISAPDKSAFYITNLKYFQGRSLLPILEGVWNPFGSLEI